MFVYIFTSNFLSTYNIQVWDPINALCVLKPSPSAAPWNLI